ncbi:YbaN family protein [Rhodospirillum sp. A1_3_36]|uniref:YbaN family protein n=1 Tax=Rhodospirillum sp. A1_3_36 TaxID=3391666 RepID=UPI0039A6E5BE
MNTGKRILFLGLGHLCVALGIIGAFLPLLPTTPFLLVATWAYGHASPRLRHWLWTHPRFGAGIRAWHEHGVIGRRVKILSLSAMTLSCLVTWLVTGNTLAALGQGIILAFVGVFIVSRPEAPPRPATPSNS